MVIPIRKFKVQSNHLSTLANGIRCLKSKKVTMLDLKFSFVSL